MIRMAGVSDEFNGDMVGVKFDSYYNYKTGFEFTVSSCGQKVNLILFNPINWNYNWHTDFNFHQLRSNLVVKWKYRLDSFIYLVWLSDMTGRTGSSHTSYG